MVRNAGFAALLLLAFAFVVTGCEKDTSRLAGGTVKASAAYLENFGQPPTAEKGQCFARVGFFPLRGEPARVRALPFFLFRESGQIQQLLDHLISGGVTLPPESGLFNPFPPGSRLHVQPLKDDVVTLELTLPDRSGSKMDLGAIAAALTETVGQFEGVERVFILLDGKSLPGAPADGYRHDPARIALPGPPALFMVAGSWEKGSANPEEIAANFDRPVEIQNFRLEDADGREIRGDYFQSVFNMSVIVHPADPTAIHEGMTVQARWDVTDNLGRRGQGKGEFRLQRYEHPATGTGPQ